MILLLLGVIIIPLITPVQYLNTNPYDIQGYGLFKTSVDPNVMDAPPLTGGHIWGTDHYGRDLFYMTWTAARTSMILALITSTLIVIIGTIVGLIWGFFRQLDPIFIEVYNLISNIPALLLYMLIAYIFQQAFPEVSASVKLVFALTITTWIGLARFIRNQTIIITNREYNIASKTLGTPASRIMLKNLLPYLLSVIITQASLIIPSMISSEVALSFFGVGLPSNATSIGALLDSGRQNYDLYPWELLAPAGLLSFIIFSFFLFGVSLTDALDPKKHR
jgi:oligopeptide transport system permease protein